MLIFKFKNAHTCCDSNRILSFGVLNIISFLIILFRLVLKHLLIVGVLRGIGGI